MAFNDYESLGSIGSSGQGMELVWRELPITVRGHYAMQWINDWRAGDPDYQLRLLRDASLGQQIDHPTLVRVHEVLLEEERAAVVTDFVDGVSLEDVLVRREAAHDPVPAGAALELAARLLDAVDHLHHLEGPDGGACFHGRITPAKVMLTVDGGAKLCGFGIAPDVPERRSAERIGPGADQYAIGLILLDLLQGRRIAVDESAYPGSRCWPEVLDDALRELDVRDPALPVVLRLLAVDPADRYLTAREASDEVQRVRSRLAGTQSLPAFAASEVERVRLDAAEETDQLWDDDAAPLTSRPEVEIWDAPGCEWTGDLELDEELALTINEERELPSLGTVPFGEAFVPKASQWWMFDGEEELSRTEPVGQVDPSLLGPPPATDTTATLPFAATYSPPGVQTRSVPSWLLAADTAPIPWGSDSNVPIPARSAVPWTSDGGAPLPSMSAVTSPLRVHGEGVTRRPPRRRPAAGPLSLPGAQVKGQRRRRRQARRRGVRQPAPHRGTELSASGFVRRWSAESWTQKSAVIRSFLVIVAFTLLIAVVEGFKRQWVTPPADPAEPVADFVEPEIID
jgi:hypothetical protein